MLNSRYKMQPLLFFRGHLSDISPWKPWKSNPKEMGVDEERHLPRLASLSGPRTLISVRFCRRPVAGGVSGCDRATLPGDVRHRYPLQIRLVCGFDPCLSLSLL